MDEVEPYLGKFTAKRVAAEIARAGGNEVCFTVNLAEDGELIDPRVVSRGNASTVLATIRQEIDYNLGDFEQLLTQPAFTKYFDGLSREESLQRPPKGYDAANPAIEYLKLKSFTTSRKLPDTALIKPGLTKQVLDAFGSLQPLVAYLNRAVV